MRSSTVLCVLFALGSACLGQTSAISLTLVAGNLGAITDITNAGDGSGRLFIANRQGVVSILRNGSVLPQPFLDLSGRILSGDECGLLGIAFPPGFASKQYFYASYTDATCQNSVIARYRVSQANPDVADPASETVILRFAQPSRSHNGGQIRFGPDGYLYAGFGDGALQTDPQDRAQDLTLLLGKMLRLDTESIPTGTYRTPATNPFVNLPQARPEIWAYGLRNPWRFSFDRQTGEMWIGDVGQDLREEINFQPAGSSGGQNYGWKLAEGVFCISPSVSCATVGITYPVLEYGRENGDASVIGGFVYRGGANAALRGAYVYGDFVSGRIWELRRSGTTWTNLMLLDTQINITTFGEDERGELYVGSIAGGLSRLDPLAAADAPVITSPSPGQNIAAPAVTFQWLPHSGFDGWSLGITRQSDGGTVFRGTLSGAATLSTVVNLPDGNYVFSLSGCTGGFTNCGPASTTPFSVNAAKPSTAPSITAPANGSSVSVSTMQFSWTGVPGASGYEVQLINAAAGGVTELSTATYGNPPALSTIVSLGSSASYQLQVRACAAACGPWSAPVNFSVVLAAAPAVAPPAPVCSMQGGQTASCSWNAVSGADIFVVQAVQDGAGPGGGALTVSSARVSGLSVNLALPPGPAQIVLAACNGNGCSPFSAPAKVTAPGPAPSVPSLAAPVPGSFVNGPVVIFAWNRVAGDNGSNTVYRLYVQDFQRAGPALDVLTRQNFWAAKFRGGGVRYDALVIAHADSTNPVPGPPSGFVVRGPSPASPTMVSPRHQTPDVMLTSPPGNVTLGWTPVPFASSYEYLIANAGQAAPLARGVTPGLLVQIPLSASSTPYSGTVRACPAGLTCVAGSDVNWGPWSSAPGESGITNFRIGP